MIRALVVEDDPGAAGGLPAVLERHSDVELVGAVESRAAIAATRELRPNVVFLDVQLSRLDGFSVASALGPRDRPLIVFVEVARDDLRRRPVKLGEHRIRRRNAEHRIRHKPFDAPQIVFGGELCAEIF